MKANDILAKSVSINSSLRREVMCTVEISNNALYNDNIRNIKIRESKKCLIFI